MLKQYQALALVISSAITDHQLALLSVNQKLRQTFAQITKTKVALNLTYKNVIGNLYMTLETLILP